MTGPRPPAGGGEPPPRRDESATRGRHPLDGRVDHFVRVVLEESMLWPVGIVILAHAVAFAAPVMLFAVRDRHRPALAALLLLVGLTLSEAVRDWRSARRLRPTTALALTVWGLGAIAAWLAGRAGIF